MDLAPTAHHTLMEANRSGNRQLNRSLEILGSGSRITSPRHDPVAFREISTHLQKFRNLEVYSNNLNNAGSTVRVALASMRMADSHLQLLDQKLRDAYFYPPDSQERATHLTEYNRLLPLLDDIAQAPDPGARRLLDSPGSFPKAGDILVKVGPGGQRIRLEAQPIHRGPGGLEVSAASNPETASNDEIRQLLKGIELARAQLQDKQKALGVDASGIENAIDFNAVIMQRHQLAAAEAQETDLNREAINARSLQIRQEMVLEGIRSLISSRDLALQLFR